jgi:hypothetical protein
VFSFSRCPLPPDAAECDKWPISMHQTRANLHSIQYITTSKCRREFAFVSLHQTEKQLSLTRSIYICKIIKRNQMFSFLLQNSQEIRQAQINSSVFIGAALAPANLIDYVQSPATLPAKRVFMCDVASVFFSLLQHRRAYM